MPRLLRVRSQVAHARGFPALQARRVLRVVPVRVVPCQAACYPASEHTSSGWQVAHQTCVLLLPMLMQHAMLSVMQHGAHERAVLASLLVCDYVAITHARRMSALLYDYHTPHQQFAAHLFCKECTLRRTVALPPGASHLRPRALPRWPRFPSQPSQARAGWHALQQPVHLHATVTHGLPQV